MMRSELKAIERRVTALEDTLRVAPDGAAQMREAAAKELEKDAARWRGAGGRSEGEASLRFVCYADLLDKHAAAIRAMPLPREQLPATPPPTA